MVGIFFIVAAATMLLLSTCQFVEAASFRQGVSAFNRQDYVSASRVFIPLAEQGYPAAQSYLGFMFETGRGVPQNYTEAAMWYRRAAEQGDGLAQYSLGLLYDRGQGLPRDIVEASKWLNLSTAAASPRSREARVRIRDAVTRKMTRGEIARGAAASAGAGADPRTLKRSLNRAKSRLGRQGALDLGNRPLLKAASMFERYRLQPAENAMGSKERASRAQATDLLAKRIEINRNYSSADFDSWLLERLAVKAGEHVLDVGCGTGAQSIPFSTLVGSTGSVSALDISAASIATLKSKIPPGAHVQAVASDMADLARVIADTFRTKQYSLAHSSYALYYCDRHLHVLDVMRGALKPGGRCAIFTTNRPHGLVDLASRFTEIPPEVEGPLKFGPTVLKPYFEKNFRRYDIHHFHNVVTVPSTETMVEFYRQTTYYDAATEDKVRAVVEDEVKRSGHYQYEKNGYLIIGFVDG